MDVSSKSELHDEYSSVYAFLCSLERFGILLGLDNITTLLSNIGDPQRSFPTVHIAGTNGKGSTAAMIYGVMRAAGFKAALYTSPHLNDFRERIRINGSMAPKEWVVESARKIREIYDPQRTTFFEFTTAVAFDCIAKAGPDIAVVEVGLGGRLDATNTVDPLVTAITDISREHEDYLGVGIESIAREKAGIIKPGVPVITGATRALARKVIHETGREKSAPVRQFGHDFVGIRTSPDRFTYRSDGLVIDDIALKMVGGHQVKNAAVACAVLEELGRKGYRIPETAWREGLRTTAFPGRFEVLRRSPDVIIDGAHTPESMRLVKHTFSRSYPGARPLILTGMLREKNWREMAAILASMAGEVVCVPPQSDRALDPHQLAARIRESGAEARSYPTIESGFGHLLEKAVKNDAILAAGSLYMIGPVRRACGLKDE